MRSGENFPYFSYFIFKNHTQMRLTAKLSFFLVLFLSISNCILAQKREDFNIPPDLGKGHLVIDIGSASTDKATESIIEAFEDNYKGKFEAAYSQYPTMSKYKPEKYQYIFVVKEKHNPARTIGRDRYPATTDYMFGLMNIKTGKTYYQDFWSGSYKKGAKNFVKEMEEIRKENAGE